MEEVSPPFLGEDTSIVRGSWEGRPGDQGDCGGRKEG